MNNNFLFSLAVAIFSMFLMHGVTVNAAESNDLEITRANFYAAWGMSTLQNMEIANNTDSVIKNIEVEIEYTNSYDNQKRVAKIMLPIELPANSKATYLKEGLNRLIVNSGGNAGMHTGKSELSLAGSGSDSLKVVKIEVTKADRQS